MSFAWQYKDAIMDNKVLWTKHKQAFAYGMLLLGRRFDGERMEMVTEHQGAARLYADLVSSLAGLRGSITITSRTRGGRETFTVKVDTVTDRKRVLERFGQEGDRLNRENLPGEEDLRAFVAGAFLSCGNLNDPQKSYRLEFVIPREGLLGDFGQLLQELGFSPRLTIRRGVPTVYFRDSEEVADLMTLTGAGRLSLELVEVKILKEMRNRTNRVTNCDFANLDKTINAAAAQVEQIRLIYDRLGEEALPEELRALAALRLENPEASLRDLGEMMDPPLSRSGVNHRLKRIEAIARGIAQGEEIE
ncbi:MAG TPA: DNA-binding protein WhiA [Firmicutes bacterium]|nr:DNA-binding protein WhiA [Bacillota bacterium]